MMPTLVQAPVRPALRSLPPPGLGVHLLGREEEELVCEVIRTKRVFRYAYHTPVNEQGAMCGALEREICEKMNVRYALAVSSGTAALEVALAALGIGEGDEVIIPAWGWVSCFTAVVRLGALPVLAEIDETFCLARGEITRLRTERTRAVMVLHYQGISADMDPLLAEAGDLPILEDCAQSIGATYRGRAAGTMGKVGIYSFQAQKTVTSGEGGVIVTNDRELYERAVRMHDLGFYRPYHEQTTPHQFEQFCGGQYRMNELTGAVALAQFRKLEWLRSHTRRLSRRICAKVDLTGGLEFRRIPDPEGDSGFEIYLCLPTEQAAVQFGRELEKFHVNCNRTTGTYCHYARPYCQNRATYREASSPFRRFEEWPAPGYRPEDFPATEGLIGRFIALPIGSLYTDEDADYIAAVVNYVRSLASGQCVQISTESDVYNSELKESRL